MEFTVEVPRTTYNSLCAFLQEWGKVYAEPNAVVLRGSMRDPFAPLQTDLVKNQDGAAVLSQNCTRALHALGRCRVGHKVAVLDLRDLEEEEVDSLYFVATVALLRPALSRSLDKIARESQEFMDLPDMVRIALAALP